ncbi:cysteine hydrolase family protein [Streptomyces sp. NPDC001848]|uniref:cysteine hydrolase family protein n=1 Tax=Streptomyces sp. NPDC001848 TaxID=3364618 RepID=UPI003678CFBB
MTTSALLVMDVQQANTSRVCDPDYLPRLARAVHAARDADIPVLHIVLGFRPGHPESNKRNKIFGALPAGIFTAEDPGAAIHPDIAPEPGEAIIVKRRVSAFAGSDLQLLLTAAGIDHLTLTGIATSGVVLSTLRQAADLDYQLTVLADGCYDLDPDTHQFLIDKVFPRQAEITTVDDWAAALSPTG